MRHRRRNCLPAREVFFAGFQDSQRVESPRKTLKDWILEQVEDKLFFSIEDLLVSLPGYWDKQNIEGTLSLLAKSGKIKRIKHGYYAPILENLTEKRPPLVYKLR